MACSLSAELLVVAATPCESANSILLRIALAGSHTRLAVVRQAFAVTGAAPPDLFSLLHPLGHGVVALRAEIFQTPALACVVDEYQLLGSLPEAQTAQAVPLPLYFSSNGITLRVAPEPRSAPAACSGAAQSSNQVLMVAPAAFASNAEAAVDNAFMSGDVHQSTASLRRAALGEHAGLYSELLRAGVRVRLFSHEEMHGTPDACFPNNWFSTCGGALALYPMKNAVRQAERRPELLAFLRSRTGAPQSPEVDLTGEERGAAARYLEGTGSLVLDHLRGVAYLARSERSDEALARSAVARLGFSRLLAFDAADEAGRPVYHTNVLLAVATGVAVVCAECIADAQRAAVLAELGVDRHVVCISRGQMSAFCGNILELQDGRGLPVIAMSTQAFNAFTPLQRAELLEHVAELVHAPLDTIERVGGGGVRCCLAELF